MKNYINLNNSELTNVFSFSFLENGRVSSNCNEYTINRFFKAAAQLADKTLLGLQFDFKKDKKVSVTTFSDSDATEEDIGWIFGECGRIYRADPDILNNFSKGREIYIFSVLPEFKEIYFEFGKEEFCRNISTLFETETSLRIIASSDGKGKSTGAILLSIPKKLPLRIRTFLSYTFQNTKIIECVGTEAEISDYLFKKLPEKIAREYTHVIFDSVKDKCISFETDNKASDEPVADDENSNNESENTINNDGKSTPLEDLDLSVRSYNCLKRSGINTVEELQALSDDELRNVRLLGRKCFEEIKQILSTLPPKSTETALKNQNYSEMLDELIGLKNVKEQVKRITALAKMKKYMSDTETKTPAITLNMEFAGNPGTAKTTVARIMAGILYESGLIESDEIIEVGRADLVARYEGQTAEKVKNVFKQAKGKMLFIDEAYSLVENFKGEFGDEAITTIVQEMENRRDNTVVVFAGYPDLMDEFIKRNPGLRSRVPFRIEFEDYSKDEMVQITSLEAKNKGFTIHPDAEKKISEICAAASNNPEAGNGRFCRNLVENAIMSYALRIFGSENPDTSENDLILISDDFPAPNFKKPKEFSPIGFCA